MVKIEYPAFLRPSETSRLASLHFCYTWQIFPKVLYLET
jgi:hypothetical protein